jgi:hypothetical protein
VLLLFTKTPRRPSSSILVASSEASQGEENLPIGDDVIVEIGRRRKGGHCKRGPLEIEEAMVSVAHDYNCLKYLDIFGNIFNN